MNAQIAVMCLLCVILVFVVAIYLKVWWLHPEVLADVYSEIAGESLEECDERTVHTREGYCHVYLRDGRRLIGYTKDGTWEDIFITLPHRDTMNLTFQEGILTGFRRANQEISSFDRNDRIIAAFVRSQVLLALALISQKNGQHTEAA